MATNTVSSMTYRPHPFPQMFKFHDSLLSLASFNITLSRSVYFPPNFIILIFPYRNADIWIDFFCYSEIEILHWLTRTGYWRTKWPGPKKDDPIVDKCKKLPQMCDSLGWFTSAMGWDLNCTCACVSGCVWVTHLCTQCVIRRQWIL